MVGVVARRDAIPAEVRGVRAARVSDRSSARASVEISTCVSVERGRKGASLSEAVRAARLAYQS